MAHLEYISGAWALIGIDGYIKTERRKGESLAGRVIKVNEVLAVGSWPSFPLTFNCWGKVTR